MEDKRMRKLMATLSVTVGLLMLSLGTAHADVSGTVGWILAQNGSGGSYVLAKIGTTYCYYDGANSAITTMIDNARRHNASITVGVDTSTAQILYVH